MVTGTHPEEIELFDYVEGDLPEGRRVEVETHLAACAACSAQVSRVQAGRDALRESQFLQLPPRRKEGVFMNLPERRRDVRSSPALSPKQLLAILTPIAAVAAVAVALFSAGGTNNDEGAASAGQTNSGGAQTTSGGAAAEGAQQDSSTPQALSKFRSVAGPADEVAAQLQSKGIDARVVKGGVEVRNATRQEVDAALGNRRAGKVEIVIVR
jgi:anti-sigma factor RsiW